MSQLSYELVPWPAVMPWGLFNSGLEEADFRHRYRARLHFRGLLGFLWVGWRAVPRGWLER